jgi:hypothetical protein
VACRTASRCAVSALDSSLAGDVELLALAGGASLGSWLFGSSLMDPLLTLAGTPAGGRSIDLR